MKYIRRFKTSSDYEVFKNGSDWITPNIVYINENSNLYLQPYVNDGEESGGGSNLTFPITLVEGDNGEIGISVYQYILTKGTDTVHLSDKEIIYITHHNKTEIASDWYYTDGSLGYIEASLQNAYYVSLYENGHTDVWD